MADKAGNSIKDANRSAFKRITTSPKSFRDAVNRQDPEDFLRLRLRNRTSLDITLDRLKADANLQLLDNRGRQIQISKRKKKKSEAINRTLDAGVYYLRVFQSKRNQSTKYQLSVSGNRDNAGDSRADAREIELTESGVQFQDFVGRADQKDYYEFTLDEDSTVDLRLSGLSGAALLQLESATGTQLARVGSSGNSAGPLERDLDAGTYYVLVAPSSKTSNTTYTLRASATLTDDGGGVEDKVGDNATGATAYTLGSSASDPLGPSDVDVYKFTPTTPKQLTLNLAGGGDASLDLYDNAQLLTPIASSRTNGTSTESITGITLDPSKTYYVKIFKSDNNSTISSLTLSSTLSAIPDEAGNTAELATALAVPIPTTGTTIKQNALLDQNDADFYKFTSPAFSSKLTLSLTGSTANADIALLVAGNSTPVAEGNASDIINEVTLTPNTNYIIRVNKADANAFTFYNLVATTTVNVTDLAPNTVDTARNLDTEGWGPTGGFYGMNGSDTGFQGTDFVGSFDTNDYYKFTLGTDSLVELTVTPTSGNADVRILSSTGASLGEGTVGTRSGTASETIDGVFAAGTYVIRVLPGTDGTVTPYTIDLQATSTEFVPAFVRDINEGSADSGTSSRMAQIGGELIFAAISNGQLGLWASNGTLETTSLIKSFTNGSIGDLFTSSTGKVYFAGNDGSGSGIELWVTDGTTGGTFEVADILDGSDGSEPTDFIEMGDKIYFTAIDAKDPNTLVANRELWVIDTSTIVPIVTKVAEINLNRGSNPTQLTNVNGTLYFLAETSTTNDLYKLDGTTPTLIEGGVGSSLDNFGELIAFNNQLYFTAQSVASGIELWRTSGTANSATLVQEIAAGNGDSNPEQLTVVGSNLFFSADNGASVNGRELWVTNGTTTSLVKDINKGLDNLEPTLPSNPTEFVAVGNTLYFTADDGKTGRELWKSDGTEVGTVQVANLADGDLDPSVDGLGSSPLGLVAIPGSNFLYFSADDGVNGRELWRIRPGETPELLELNPGAEGSNPTNLVEFNGRLFFRAESAEVGSELWVVGLPLIAPPSP